MNERILEAFDTFNALNLTDRLSENIHFENRKPQGTEYLYDLVNAIKNKVQISFNYQNFDEDDYSHRIVEPYALKEFQNRWYVIVYDLKDNSLKRFALDRLSVLQVTNKPFQFPIINVKEHYKYCFGIISPNAQEPVDIILSFSQFQGMYVKTLPFHETQEIILDNEEELRIKLRLFITFDFIKDILSYGENIKIIEPASLIDEIKNRYQKAMNQYDK